MRRIEFGASRQRLSAALLKAAKDCLAEENLQFDKANFEQHTSVDMRQLAQELLFFGADIFPQDTVSLVEAA